MKIQLPCWLLLWAVLMSACKPAGNNYPSSTEPAFTEPPAATFTPPPGPKDNPTEAPAPDILPVETAEYTAVLAIHNGVILDGTGAPPISNGIILVQNGVITAIGSDEDIEIPNSATVLDAQGGTILPGLIDTHSHLAAQLFVKQGKISPTLINQFLVRPLEAGVTTIRDLGSAWGAGRDMADLRTALASLENPVPTLILSGPILAAPDSPIFSIVATQALAVDGEDEARTVTEDLLDGGADFIKILVGSVFGGGANSVIPSLTPEQVQAITLAANARGVRVTAHATNAEDVMMVINNGVDELAHWPAGGTAIPESLIQLLVAAQVPIVTTFTRTSPQAGDVRLFLDAGGTLVFGTDTKSVSEAAMPINELVAMLESGMTPMEVIVAATGEAANLLELQEQVGTLEVGKMADIIVVVGDPLSDMHAMEDVVIVIKEGHVVKNLDARP